MNASRDRAVGVEQMSLVKHYCVHLDIRYRLLALHIYCDHQMVVYNTKCGSNLYVHVFVYIRRSLANKDRPAKIQFKCTQNEHVN